MQFFGCLGVNTAMQVLNKSIEALVTGSTNYTIRDVIDDGTGMTTLMLETDLTPWGGGKASTAQGGMPRDDHTNPAHELKEAD